MSECVFDTVLQEWAENEWEGYSDAPGFKTSKKHDRAMRRIFKRYERNTRKLRPQAEIKTMVVRKRIIVALVVIILAVFTGFTAAYFISRGFRGRVYSEYTELFPIKTENCPEYIEAKYYLPELPEGFEILDTDSTPFYEHIAYKNKQTGQTITLEQWVKPEYDSTHLNTEMVELVELEINGHPGVFLDFSNDEQYSTIVIWDNGDYIFEISADLPKNYLVNLAKSAKVLEK